MPITGLDTGLPALVVQLVPVGPAWLHGGGEGPEGSVYTLGLLAAAAVGLLLARQREGGASEPPASGHQL